MHRTFGSVSSRLGLLLFCGLLSPLAPAAQAAPPEEAVVQGLYEGTWKDGAGETPTEVRVVAMGGHVFRLMARRVLDGKPVRADIEGKLDGDAVVFTGKQGDAEWKARWADGAIEGAIAADGALKVKRVERKSPSLGKAPPEGAVVLLDGKKSDGQNFEQMERGGKPWRLGPMSQHGWPIYEMALTFEGTAKEPPVFPTPENPLPPGWKLLPEKRKVDMVIGIDEDGSIEVPKGGMSSKKDFAGSFDAHIEFRCNFNPKARSQGRGNSGVDLPNGQEIQVLDSFGMGTYLGGCCGGLYNKKDPDGMEPILSLAGKPESTFTLASLPPLEWQTYDIEFRVRKEEAKPAKAPKKDEVKKDGKDAAKETNQEGAKADAAKDSKPEAKDAKPEAKDAKPEAKDAKPEAKQGKPEPKAAPKVQVEKGYLTVYHNGIKIHDSVELGKGASRFRFQDHGNAVRYRNIWVLPVKAEAK